MSLIFVLSKSAARTVVRVGFLPGVAVRTTAVLTRDCGTIAPRDVMLRDDELRVVTF